MEIIKQGISKSNKKISVKSHVVPNGGCYLSLCEEYVLYCDDIEILKIKEYAFDKSGEEKRFILEVFEKMLLI